MLSRIRSLVRSVLGVDNTVTPGSGSVIDDVALYAQHNRIGGGLTPQQVSTFFYQADIGQISNLVNLAFDSREKDGHLHSVLQTRETSLGILPLNVNPYIEPGQYEPTESDSEIAAFVQYYLEQAIGYGQRVKSFDDTIEHLGGAVYLGHATSEIMWDVKDNYNVPVGFKPINQRRFEFSQDNGTLLFNDGYFSQYAVDLQEVFPAKFVQHMPRITGDIAVREGLYHLLIWFALFRNWTFSDWLKLAELSWKPWRIGKYSINASEEDKDNLLNIMRRLTTNGVALLRDDLNVEIRWPTAEGRSSSENSHQTFCTFMGSEISKAVLGQTLTTEQGERGARSLGEIHNQVRMDIRLKDAKGLGRTLQRDLVPYLVQFNFGPKPKLPTIEIDASSKLDVSTIATAVEKLSKSNAEIPVRWVHDQLGVTRRDEEPVIGMQDNANTDPIQDSAP